MFSCNVAPATGRRLASLFAAMVVGVTTATTVPAQQPSVQLHIFRFWRPPNLTLIEAFTTTPLSLLSFTRVNEGNGLQSIIERRLEVIDSSGLAILNQLATDTIAVPAMSETSIARSEVAQHFAFQTKPGSYRVRFTLTDTRTGQKWTAEANAVAFRQMPRISDLVMASDLLTATVADSTPQHAIVRGKLAVIPNFTGALTPDKARVALYTEVYRHGMPQDSAQVQILVTNASGFRYQTPTQARIYPAGIGSEAFALDLTGLPPGEYQLRMKIASAPHDTLELGHRVAMLPLGAGQMEKAAPRIYADLSEAQLDSVWGPIRYIATAEEIDQFENLAGAESKRRWLGNFWQMRAAAAGETVDGQLREWNDRLAIVNRDFQPARRGQGGRLGWQTDRGRIWMKHGPPHEREIANQTRSQEIKACEQWQYTTGRGDRYVFFDRTGFGEFELVFSTDRNEPPVPGFEALFKDRRFSCTTV
jgi:GWxTD domain-containing protein